MVRRVAGVVEGVEAPAVPEVDRADVAEHHQALLWNREEVAEQSVHVVAEDPVRAGHELAGIGEVTSASLVHDDLRVREGCGDVADSAGVVEVDVRDDDGGEVGRVDAELGEGADDEIRGARRAGLDEAGPAAPDQVAGRDALVAAHAGVDVEDVAAQVLDDLRHRISMAAPLRVVPRFSTAAAAIHRPASSECNRPASEPASPHDTTRPDPLGSVLFCRRRCRRPPRLARGRARAAQRGHRHGVHDRRRPCAVRRAGQHCEGRCHRVPGLPAGGRQPARAARARAVGACRGQPPPAILALRWRTRQCHGGRGESASAGWLTRASMAP